MQINIIEDFDRLITIKLHGYPSLEDYYHDASNNKRVAHVNTPLIAVNPVDDPFVPMAGNSRLATPSHELFCEFLSLLSVVRSR